jgi:hypothetical protein
MQNNTPTRDESSRINGAKSRGPKTEAGRRRSSMNALRHGFLAECVVLDESRLHKMYQRALNPNILLHPQTNPSPAQQTTYRSNGTNPRPKFGRSQTNLSRCQPLKLRSCETSRPLHQETPPSQTNPRSPKIATPTSPSTPAERPSEKHTFTKTKRQIPAV